jgi:hypothetical protein
VDTDDIRTLYDYNTWADRRIVAMARSLNREEFTKIAETAETVEKKTPRILGVLCVLGGNRRVPRANI